MAVGFVMMSKTALHFAEAAVPSTHVLRAVNWNAARPGSASIFAVVPHNLSTGTPLHSD